MRHRRCSNRLAAVARGRRSRRSSSRAVLNSSGVSGSGGIRASCPRQGCRCLRAGELSICREGACSRLHALGVVVELTRRQGCRGFSSRGVRKADLPPGCRCFSEGAGECRLPLRACWSCARGPRKFHRRLRPARGPAGAAPRQLPQGAECSGMSSSRSSCCLRARMRLDARVPLESGGVDCDCRPPPHLKSENFMAN